MAWHLIYRPEALTDPPFAAFRNWLLSEVQASQNADPTLPSN
jgi:hypothetical protein